MTDDPSLQIKDQLELQNDHRTNLLTLLAAIYIPFSFISVSRLFVSLPRSKLINAIVFLRHESERPSLV